MPYKVIELQLTDEQIAEIEATLGDTVEPFALLAHPQVRGLRSGQMPVYILTAAQYKAIDKGVIEGRAMLAWPE